MSAEGKRPGMGLALPQYDAEVIADGTATPGNHRDL